MSSSEDTDIVTCTVKLPARKRYIVHWQSKEPITAWCEIHTKGPTGRVTTSIAKCEMDASNQLTQVRSSRDGLEAGRNLSFYGRKTSRMNIGMAWLEIRRATAIRVSEVTKEERRLTIDWVPSDRPDSGTPYATFVFNFELTAPPPARSLSPESEDPGDEEEDELVSSDHHFENGTPTDASHISESPVISDSTPPTTQTSKINSISKRQSAKVEDSSQRGSPSVPKRLKRDSATVSPNSKQPSPKRPRVDRSTARIDKPSPRSGKSSTRKDKQTTRTDKPTSRIGSPASRIGTQTPYVEIPIPHVEAAATPDKTPTTHVESPFPLIPYIPPTNFYKLFDILPVDGPTSTNTPPTNTTHTAAPPAPDPAPKPALEQKVAAEQEQPSEPPSPSEPVAPEFLDVSDNDDDDESYTAKIAKLDLEINSYTEKYKLLEAKDAYMQVKREWAQLLSDVCAAELACGVKPPKETLTSDSDQEESYIVKRKKLELEIPMLKNRLVVLKDKKKYLEKKDEIRKKLGHVVWWSVLPIMMHDLLAGTWEGVDENEVPVTQKVAAGCHRQPNILLTRRELS
ncbi:hypothetical protein BU17DRAFT_63039 [Hysterangium stoloniferum]|nr:hypothetical protein BU17DRAFT_63039 [Hysterangium stoloniferum]